MGSEELIEFLSSQPFTHTQAYNLVTDDLIAMHTEAELLASQKVIAYFNYKITEVLLPAIERAKIPALSIANLAPVLPSNLK